jgi:hypothetical protein
MVIFSYDRDVVPDLDFQQGPAGLNWSGRMLKSLYVCPSIR